MGKYDDVPAGQPRGSRRDLSKFFRHSASWHKKGAAEGIRVSLFGRSRNERFFQHFGLAPCRYEMTRFVRRSLGSAFPSVVRIEKNASPDRLFIREKTGYPTVESADVNSHAKFKFKQTDNILNWTNAQTDPLPKFKRIQFGLLCHITGQNQSFGRIVPRALDPK